MPKRDILEDLLNHIDNLEMAMNDKVENILAATDQLIDIRQELTDRGPKAPDVAAIKGELFDIWNSVMESEYDEDF